YVAWLGRWVSADPVGIVVGPNLYLYVGGNPARLVDLEGAAPEEAGPENFDLTGIRESSGGFVHLLSGSLAPSRKSNERAALRAGARSWARQVAGERLEQGRAAETDFTVPGQVTQDLAASLVYNNAAWEAGEPDRKRVEHFYGKGLSTREEDQRMW